MFDRIAQWQPDQGAAVAARTVGALALVALAVIHVVDLPGTLGPDPAGRHRVSRDHRRGGPDRRGAARPVAPAGLGGRRRRGRLGDGRIHPDPRPAGRLPGRSRRCRELALPAGHRRAQRGVGDHPARPARRGRRLAGADPRRERGGAAPASRAARARVQPVPMITPWPPDPRQTPLDPRPACRRALEGALRCVCPSPARPARPTRPRGGGGCSRGLSRRTS